MPMAFFSAIQWVRYVYKCEYISLLLHWKLRWTISSSFATSGLLNWGVKMHQIRFFSPGLYPGPRWGSSRRSPNLLVGWGGDTPSHTSPLEDFGVYVTCPLSKSMAYWPRCQLTAHCQSVVQQCALLLL